MPQHRRATPEDPRSRDDERAHKLTALRARVQAEAGRIHTPDDWARCLNAAALLRQNFANSLLIVAQQPTATLVKGYEDWRKSGRQVTRGEKGIEIFASAPPPPEPERPARGRHQEPRTQAQNWRDATRIAHVWDISQTTGQPVAAQTAPKDPDGLWDALSWLARREGFAVEREHGAPPDGVTFWAARRIRVLPGLTTAESAWALAHQLGHVLLHGTVPQPPGATTSGDACLGVRKAEADAVAYLICTRYGTTATSRLTHPQTWAGTDPRAQPAATILAVGERITIAAARTSHHLDRTLPHPATTPAAATATPTQPSKDRHAAATRAPAPQQAERPSPPPTVIRALADAERFYTSQLTASWVPSYLATRGIGQAAIEEWQIGYAPVGWTTLTTHLRDLGHADHDIEAAGLARRSTRGTLIDHFRDRVMLPIHDQHGTLVGFTGRASPGARPEVPRYLNTPQTAAYNKSELLFGWQQARRRLAAGAIPVIAEGPFDAIAVTLATPTRYAGLAPCGTALTSHQAALLSQASNPSCPRIIVAFDDDPAGRKAAIRAYAILRPVSDQLYSAILVGRDPAQILQDDGAQALRAILSTRLQPLSALIIDAALNPWEHRLHETAGPLLAMRSAATVIAGLLPADAAAKIRFITAGRELATTDDQLRPIPVPELPEIATALPADTNHQITRVADRLGFTYYSDVLAEVANAVTRNAARPDGAPHDLVHRLVRDSFPHPAPTARSTPEPVSTRPPGPGPRPQRTPLKR